MWKPDVDVLIPTSKKRLDNLMCQIHTAQNQGFQVRITIAMSGQWIALEEKLGAYDAENIRLVYDAPDGLIGNPAVQYCIQNLEWCDWYYQTGDDDSLMPWGLKHLYEQIDEHSKMIIGQAICVTKNDHRDISHKKVGRVILEGAVSGVCVLFHMPSVKKLSPPWWNPESKVADYELIRKMANSYPYKVIPNTVTILSLI